MEETALGPAVVQEAFLEEAECELLIERWTGTEWQEGHQLDPVKKPSPWPQLETWRLTLGESLPSASLSLL